MTTKQETYCRRAIGITPLIYNLCVATRRFCLTNRVPWPSWQNIFKAFNGCKREDYPFVLEVAARVQEGAFMDFGAVLRNWRDPDHSAGPPRFRKRRRTGAGSFRAASGVAQLRYDGKRRIRLPVVGSVKMAHTLSVGIEFERIDRWYPSSKMCSACGHVKSLLLLTERIYRCVECGHEMDRDENAALNIENAPPSAGIVEEPSDSLHFEAMSSACEARLKPAIPLVSSATIYTSV